MAEILEMPADFGSPEAAARTAKALVQRYALRSSMYVLDKAKAFTRAEGRKLLILLSHGEPHVANACNGLPRFDRPFVDYLRQEGLPFVDTLDKHAKDFESFRCSPEEYCRRFYYKGHYNPAGNHFFAFAVKDGIAAWLDPKPPAYDLEKGPSL